MAINRPPPNTPNPTALLSSLLDAGYTETTGAVIAAIARDTERGALADRLKQFEERAKELSDKGESMGAEDPVLRALLADFADALKKDALLIDAVSPGLEDIGIDAAGQFVRQTSLPGISDEQLVSVGVKWNSPDPEAINAVVNFTTSDAWAEMLKKYGDIEGQVRDIALRGIVAGRNPLSIASDVRAALESIPAYQANALMRTLQLESYRAAVAANQDANRDILEVQIRIAALDDRTCLCCIALHGTEMPIGATVEDHDNGRCTSVTQLRGMPSLDIQTGEAWFNSLPEDRQLEIAGAGAFDALKRGDVQLLDFVQPYSSPIFGDMVRQAGLGTALDNPNRMIRTIDGYIRADRGKPGDSEESLTAFVNGSDGPLARALKSDEMGLLELDWGTDLYTVNGEAVSAAAKRFVEESQDIKYGKDYILSLVQAEAARNGVTVDTATAAKLYNQQFGYQANAIQTAANIGDVKLTPAQVRRLDSAIAGNYLDIVYTTQSSLTGSLENSTRVKSGAVGGSANMTDAAKREARLTFLDNMGRLR